MNDKKRTRKHKPVPSKVVSLARTEINYDTSVGNLLRETRESQRIELADVASALNLRVLQLRALEEGDMDSLPGMTYAQGFVRSYSAYLGLNSADVVQKFKLEHGASANLHNLHFPEPVTDGPQPNFLMIGIAAFCAVLVLVFWAVFSGGDKTLPAEQTASSTNVIAPVDAMPVIQTAPAPVEQEDVQAVASTEGGTTTSSVDTAAVAQSAGAMFAQSLGVSDQLAADNEKVADTVSPVVEAVKEPVVEPVKEAAKEPVKDVAKQPSAAAVKEAKPIQVQNTKGRVVLTAKQASWIEVKDASGQTLYKKVLRPGEKYVVPDQKGVKLVTSNAGGLDVAVDGASVPQLGGKGEIVHGVSLSPDALKSRKAMYKTNR